MFHVDVAAMQRLQGRSVPDRDDAGARQLLAQKSIHHALAGFVERRRCLIEKQPIGCHENGAHEREALLLSEREPLLPVRLLIKAMGELGEANALQ